LVIGAPSKLAPTHPAEGSLSVPTESFRTSRAAVEIDFGEADSGSGSAKQQG